MWEKGGMPATENNRKFWGREGQEKSDVHTWLPPFLRTVDAAVAHSKQFLIAFSFRDGWCGTEIEEPSIQQAYIFLSPLLSEENAVEGK